MSGSAPDTIDPRVRAVPPAVQAGVFKQPEPHLEALVRFLVADAKSPTVQVKRLHDWVADNIRYDTETYFGKHAARQGWREVLQHGQATCGGYAGLFQRMCEIAGIECAMISGHAKGFSFRTFGDAGSLGINHTWDAVRLDGTWRLVDVTWDAGKARTKDKRFQKQYATDYFLTAPEVFAYTHFPAEAKWQLLEKSLTAPEFAQRPKLTGRFGSHGLKLLEPLERIRTVKGEVGFTMQVPRQVSLLTNLYMADGKNLKYGAFLQRCGERVQVRVGFTEPGTRLLKIYCKTASLPKEAFALCLELGYRNTVAGPHGLPWTYPGFVEGECVLHGPLRSPLPAGEKLVFEVTVPKARSVKLVDARAPQRMKSVPGKRDTYRIETHLSAKAGLVWIAATRRGRRERDEPLVLFRKAASGK